MSGGSDRLRSPGEFAVDDIDDVVARLRSHGVELVGEIAPTQIRPMIRVYYPTPGSDTQASILPPPSPLPPPNGSLDASYVFPALQQVN